MFGRTKHLMKKRLIIILFAFFLIDACQQQEQGATTSEVLPSGTPTVTAVTLPPPVITTATTNPTTVPLPTHVATATEIPRLSPTPPLEYGHVPLPEATTFRLRSPDPNILLDIIMTSRPYTLPGTRDIGMLIQSFDYVYADLTHYYPYGLPGSLRAIEITDKSFRSKWFESPKLEAVWAITQASVVEYLNQHNIQFEPEVLQYREDIGLEFIPYPAQISSNPGEEWLLKTIYYHSKIQPVLTIIPVSIDSNGQYQLVPNVIKPPQSGYADIDVTTDITGDHLSDIVVVEINPLRLMGESDMAFLNPEDVDVYSWDGAQIKPVGHTYLSRGADDNDQAYRLGDYNADGLNELQLFVPRTADFGCNWMQVDTYHWQNEVLQKNQYHQDVPDTVLCTLALILKQESDLTAPEKITVLEAALTDMDIETAPSADYLALLYVHLAMLYSSQAQEDQAVAVLNQLYDLPEDGRLRQLFTQTYEASDGSLLAFCNELYGITRRIPWKGWGPPGPVWTGLGSDVDADISASVYRSPAPLPARVCPLNLLIDQRLEMVTAVATASPITNLENLGIPIAQSLTVNMDADPEMEWVGLLALNDPQIIIFDSVAGVWQGHSVARLETNGDTDFETTDIDGDNLPELVVWHTIAEDEAFCWDVAIRMSISIIHRSGNGFELVEHESDCYSDSPIALAHAGEDKEAFLHRLYFEHRLVPAPEVAPSRSWFRLEGFEVSEYETIERYLQSYLEPAVWSQTDADTIVNEINALLDYLPQNNPEAELYAHRLTYLLGYHYELSGDEEAAVSTYLDLIQQIPDSIWAWLAWSRLEVVEDIGD